MSNPKVIKFFFDYVSHNSYIAWTQIHKLARRNECLVEPIPVVFGAMLKANNAFGPAEVPPKNNWMIRDILLKAQRLGIPLNPPASHPFNPLLLLRSTYALQQVLEGEKNKEELYKHSIDSFFKAVWVDSKDATKEDVVISLIDNLHLKAVRGTNIIEQAQSSQVKDALRKATENAMSLGVFGVPTCIVNQQLFWGFDDFLHLEMYLKGELKPINEEELARWKSVKPSVVRSTPTTSRRE